MEYPVVDWTKLPVPDRHDLDAVMAYNNALLQNTKLGPLTEAQQKYLDQVKKRYIERRTNFRSDAAKAGEE